MCDGWPAGPAPSKFYSTPISSRGDYATVVTEREAREAVMRVGDNALYRTLFNEDIPRLD